MDCWVIDQGTRANSYYYVLSISIVINQKEKGNRLI